MALELERAANKARGQELTEVQCRTILSDILERTTGDTIRNPSIAEWLETWLDGKEVAKSAGTIARYRFIVEEFKIHLGDRAKRPITTISPKDIQGFLNKRQKAGLSPKTVSVDAKTLSSAFGKAVKQHLIPHNPVSAVDLPKVISSKRGTFTSAQVGLIVKAADEADWKTAILLGFYTGARLGDCKSMTWDNVDLSAGVIAYTPQKTEGTGDGDGLVTVPIHPDLLKYLMKLAGTDDGKLLCPTLAPKDTGGAHGLSQKFKAIMRDAGIDPGTAAGKGRRQFSKLTFHALRHSFASALANANVSEETRMALTGHKTQSVHRNYTHHELATLRKAVGKLPSIQ